MLQRDAGRPDLVREPEAPAYSGRSHPGRASGLPPELARKYRRPGLREVDLGFAGRRHDNHPLHRAITALAPGDRLEASEDDQGRWELLDRAGTPVGRLASGFESPRGTRCSSAKVLAVVGWSRELSDPKYHDGIKCDSWEVVVPELVFEPVRAVNRRDCFRSPRSPARQARSYPGGVSAGGVSIGGLSLTEEGRGKTGRVCTTTVFPILSCSV